MMEESAHSRTISPPRLLVRGESLVGFVGIGIASILLAMIGLSCWWSLRSQQEAWQFVRAEQMRVLAHILSQSAESMLAGNDLSALRRLLVEAKQHHDLKECQIVLANGEVLADADPTKITIAATPAQWPGGPIDDVPSKTSVKGPEQISINMPLLIKGRGSAMFRITALNSMSITRLWDNTAGIGLIGAAGLAAMLIVYRHMRARVVTLGLIRDSLLASQGGNTAHDVLTLRDELGPEAAAWNNLIEENQNLRNAGVAARLKGSLGDRREARGNLEHACDALSVGMIILDEKACVKHANGAAAAMLQIKRDLINGQQITKLMDDPAATEAIEAIVSGSGQRRTLELQRTEAQGGGILRVHLRPTRRDDCGGALITIDDITQQRVADAARNSFVAQATHELRTPLTNMRLCLESALEEQDPEPKLMREHFNTLNLETRRLERMVGEMLSVAQIEAGSLQLNHDEIRLEKVFEELQADYKQQATDKQITLLFDLPPKFPVIPGDRDKIMVALHNLLGNALKYTNSGGKVIITVRTDGSRLTVDVTDTGIGISLEEQQKLFQKFYRAKDPRISRITGTGLGLALAREIARLHNGDISVQSELEKGSTFTLTLPATTQARAA